YKTADIFLSTSLYEGYGMSMAEANVAECPIIATDAGIAPKIARHLCPVGDVVCLASAIERIIR
ncbi:MAG TPA: glycosyltransferase, partial [Candidatus Paceibacterota bacterium]|nr:glycosyltransferase [Candidatus Paceibacterota bacterium]